MSIYVVLTLFNGNHRFVLIVLFVTTNDVLINVYIRLFGLSLFYHSNPLSLSSVSKSLLIDAYRLYSIHVLSLLGTRYHAYDNGLDVPLHITRLCLPHVPHLLIPTGLGSWVFQCQAFSLRHVI